MSKYIKRDKVDKVLITIGTIIFSAFIIFTLVFYIMDTVVTKSMIKDNENLQYEELTDWMTYYDGRNYQSSLPKDFDISDGKKVVLETKLPDNLDLMNTIDFYNSLDADVYVNDELRYSFKDNNYFPGGVLKQFHSFIRLTPDDAGGTLRIESREEVRSGISVARVYIGTSYGLFSRILDLNLKFFIFAISLIIIASLTLLLGIIMKIFRSSDFPIISAGLVTLFVSLWLVFNSELYQFIYHNNHVAGIMGNMMQALIPLPLIAYIDKLQNGRYTKPYVFNVLIYQAVTIVFSIFHFAQGTSYQAEMIYLGTTEIAFFVLCAFGLLMDYIKDFYKQYLLSFIGTALFLLAAIIEVALYIIIEERHVGTVLMVGTYAWVMFAITEQLVNLRQAENAQKAALSANEAKSNFLANMSHEIRTPMNAILGMDEMIIREEHGNETVIKYAKDIKSAGNMLLSIINDILDLSKIESGNAELVITDFETSNVIEDISNITKSRAADKGLSYHVDVDSKVPKGFVGDEIRVRQIMLNVIGNAIKYTNEGWVNVDVRYETSDGEGVLVVAVTDTGIGIKKEDQKELFNSFSRLEVTRNRKIEGTGLGLTITLNYLNMMGGHIDVESEYGKGSVFTISIPLKTWDDTPLGDFNEYLKNAKPIEEYVPLIMAEDAKVLVVDDNEMNLDVINGLLKPTKVCVDNASSGPEALELVRRRHYDLILLDQMMPDMDGTETMNIMKSKGIKAPIVVLTADAGAKQEYLEKGFDGFVAKPVEGIELEEALKEYLPKELLFSHEKIMEELRKEKEQEERMEKLANEKKKKALIIDEDPKKLQELMAELDDLYDGTYVRDIDKANKYLSRHDVDYVIFKDLKVVEKANKV
ncbi:MAG: response regulator [Lachnospiraceae bacterium]|nr:response regulator [Lachnospiraceae bacterium]